MGGRTEAPVKKFNLLESEVGAAVTVVDTRRTTVKEDGIAEMKTLLQEMQRMIANHDQSKKIEPNARI